ncbi:Bromodomain containing protein [Trichomonas vaginalis G3]|uniref:Bromodomain containing protein n=1 Tax=Trichomonas vaginalis (strain ATCC PRA-98 / G3) TaxID=412133 RepID=A2FQ94_TRIV3|nr:bromodomain family [Trichomonas vaginalis G3]EAX92929.1 Bromodomain containing protein [Trichomonas vaginalis G3]KAI5510110.1 bromodomain family [Trichomonas vaginalis G3]|eukprot:XP_001305859.1 Bromodomain containing protein [Trichomonas vaginalis G3]
MFAKSSAGQFCLKVTNAILENQIAEIFKRPVATSPTDPYLAVIKEPMDLGTVKSKIKDNSYTTIADWKYDMNLIFNNAVQYNGEKSLIGGIAAYLKNKFEKLLKTFEYTNKQNYEERLRSLYRQLIENSEKLYSVELDKTYAQKYDLLQLEEKLSQINDSTNIEEILRQYGYESLIKKGKSTINLDSLKRECLDAIWREITIPKLPPSN